MSLEEDYKYNKSLIKSLFGQPTDIETPEPYYFAPLPDRFGEFNFLPSTNLEDLEDLGDLEDGYYVPNITKEFIKNITYEATTKLFLYKNNSKEDFVEQVRRVFPNNMAEEEILSLTKEDFVEAMTYGLLNTAKNNTNNDVIITPWIIESVKEQVVKDFFEPTRSTLPIVVTVDENNYTHQCSEELIFGILVVISPSTKYTFDIGNNTNLYHLRLKDLKRNYDLDAVGIKRYTCMIIRDNISPKLYTFNSIDFIQGVITGASWLNLDPHKYIVNIRDGNILVTF